MTVCTDGLSLISLSVGLGCVGSWAASGRLSWLSTFNLTPLISRAYMLSQCHKPPKSFQPNVFDLFFSKDAICIRVEYGASKHTYCLVFRFPPWTAPAGLNDRVSILILMSPLVFCLSLELVRRSVKCCYPKPLSSSIPTLCSPLLTAPELCSGVSCCCCCSATL